VRTLLGKLRRRLEAVIYAGITPVRAPSPPRRTRWFDPLHRRLDRFLSGGEVPRDPLYLTNRTFGQRLRLAIAVAIPCLVLVGLITAGFAGYFHVREKPQAQLTGAEIAARTLPGIDTQNLHAARNRDLEVLDALISDGHVLSGAVRNNTGHAIDDITVVFDLADISGTRLGAAAVHIAHVEARGTSTFHLQLEQQNAAVALVREVQLP